MEIGQHFTLPPDRYRTLPQTAEVIAVAESGVYYAFTTSLKRTVGMARGCSYFLRFADMPDDVRNVLISTPNTGGDT